MINCDLFSLGEINVMDGDKVVENDPIYNLLNEPNPFQTRRQFLWDYMFWNMLGCATMYGTSHSIIPSTRLYWLNQANIEFPTDLKRKLDKIVRSNQSHNDLERELIRYNYADGTQTTFKLGELKTFADISNGLGNWYDSPSRLNALYKVISNSEEALDAKNINLRFSGKFIVSGKVDDANIFETQLTNEEKESITRNTLDKHPVTPLKSMIDIKRYVEDNGKLKLDESYEYDYFTIGTMYNIPKEVLSIFLNDGNSLNSNAKEKAVGNHVMYSLQPKADDLANGLETYFGYDQKQNIDITITFDHLQCMQVFMEEKANVCQTKSTTMMNLIRAGVDPDDAAKVVGLDVKFVKKDENANTETPAATN